MPRINFDAPGREKGRRVARRRRCSHLTDCCTRVRTPAWRLRERTRVRSRCLVLRSIDYLEVTKNEIQGVDMFYFALPGIQDIRPVRSRKTTRGQRAGLRLDGLPGQEKRVCHKARPARWRTVPNWSTWLITGCGRPGRRGQPSGARSRRRKRAGRRALPPARRGSRTRLLCRLRAGRAAAAAPRARVPAQS